MRGEVWTLQDKAYASKARPVVIIQAELEHSFDSVVICLFTSYESNHISTRVKIEPSVTNGLNKISFVMTEKLVTVDKKLLGEKIGNLTTQQMIEISRQLAKILEIKKEYL
ncbi:MAG: type II toxin-antitoxin system PemK/MazF family toxin [Fibromonadaceae bacterium]|jgi:mRNA interferase MazF|nr:type II toxin-antitoxin system PemK/MazF family toxin [Fibromonadaceae bacterium]